MAEVIYFFSLLWYNTHGPIRGLAAYSVYLLFSQQILRFAGIACSYHALRKKISASQLLSSPANMVQYPRTYPWVSRLQRLSAVFTANSTIRRHSLLIPCLAEENICFAAAFFPCKHGKIPLGNHQRKDEGSSYGNYPAKGAISFYCCLRGLRRCFRALPSFTAYSFGKGRGASSAGALCLSAVCF